MRPDEVDAAHLWDMLEACREIREFVDEGDWDTFIGDRKLVLAVERSLEVIGEAAGRVSEQFQAAHPGISWKEIRGMRNVLAHEYGAVDHQVIYKTVTHDLPALLKKLEKLLA